MEGKKSLSGGGMYPACRLATAGMINGFTEHGSGTSTAWQAPQAKKGEQGETGL